MEEQQNLASERAVLAGLMQYGADAFDEIEEIVGNDSFTLEENQVLFACIKRCLKNDQEVDITSILSAGESLGYSEYLSRRIPENHYRSLTNLDVSVKATQDHALLLRKLCIRRRAVRDLLRTVERLQNLDDSTSIDNVISTAEEPIFTLSDSLNQEMDNKPVLLGEGVREHMKNVFDNPCKQIGISSGFPRYDKAIGGGFRRKCVDVIGARPKTGKSMFADAVAIHAAVELDIPVLILDTEMSEQDHWHRILARFSGYDINDIATGNAAEQAGGRESVLKAIDKFEKSKIHYKSVAGRPFDETLSIIRRWVKKEVGSDENGNTKDCLVIYDYLKIMSASETADRQEYEVLGQQMIDLHNLAKNNDFACLTFVQLNRDGISRESTDAVAGSDRIIWNCTSFSIFKLKSDEEIAEDKGESGNRKLIPIVVRHGAGLENIGDYINLKMKGSTAEIEETGTKVELQELGRFKKEGFDNEVPDKQEFRLDESEAEEDPFA